MKTNMYNSVLQLEFHNYIAKKTSFFDNMYRGNTSGIVLKILGVYNVGTQCLFQF